MGSKVPLNPTAHPKAETLEPGALAEGSRRFRVLGF